ncbi:MAG: EF-hand domain-containing protein, partial [Candidatus Sericytochromatia bacterium]
LHRPAPCVTPDPGTVANTKDRRVMRAPAQQTWSPAPPPDCEPAAPQLALPPFEHWDKNRDQFIDRGELCEPIAVPPLPPQRPPCEETFKRADRNADGSLSPEEYFAADYAPPPPDGMARPAVMPTEGELAARFKGLDVTGDGKLDPKEFCMDWGTVTPASPMPTPVWNDCYGTVKSYDRNQDGKVSWEEYYEGFLAPISARYEGQKDEVYARFKALDANGDGALAPEEFCPPNTTPAPVVTRPPVMNEPNR